MKATNAVMAALEQARDRGLIVSERSSGPMTMEPQEVTDEGGEVPLLASVHVAAVVIQTTTDGIGPLIWHA